MTSLKTKNICFLAAFLFLSIVPTLAEVVDTWEECSQFLYEKTPPHIPGILKDKRLIQENNNPDRYKFICQTYENERRFLTLYDTVNRIPVFSAYEYRGSEGKRPTPPWMIEPQLENRQNDGNMTAILDGTYTHQAVDKDYKDGISSEKRNVKINYDRGHLFPSSHAFNDDDHNSTFTLTNIVPQVKIFKGKRWNTMENCLACIMDYHIKRTVQCFVVAGALPSDNYFNNNPQNNPRNKAPQNRNRVNIPSVMWSAFYCDNQMSGAYWSNNDADDTLHEGSLEELKTNPLTEGIDAFPGMKKTLKNYFMDFLAAIRDALKI